jgi:transposase InsO family protein
MTIRMQDDPEQMTLEQMKTLVNSSRTVRFTIDGREAFYELVGRVLKNHRYARLGREEKGIVRLFLARVTGRSRSQITRLIGQWIEGRIIQAKRPQRRRFPTLYKADDAARLAEVDAAHDGLAGPAVRRILQREYEVFGKQEFEQLAKISVSHLYNLRRSKAYRKVRVQMEHTQASKVSIAERRKPEPRGRPGYLRVDTVHQGHHDGRPGLFHINAVDTVTQWQVVGCVETIAERHLLPVLEAMLQQIPFVIQGFHCDNGSEFINYQVAGLLEKLRVEFTKSRAYRTTDNALVEGKNGAVIRKHIGYGPIQSLHAEDFQKFFTAYLNPYLNYHRPCGFATVTVLARGRRKRTYPVDHYRTPLEKLKSLPNWESHLKPTVTAERLEAAARKMSDTEAARKMQTAKNTLLTKCRGFK